MVNIRREGSRTYSGGRLTSVALMPPKAAILQRPRRNITDVVEEPEEQIEMIDAPDQFIDTEDVNYLPVQSANGAIRSVLY